MFTALSDPTKMSRHIYKAQRVVWQNCVETPRANRKHKPGLISGIVTGRSDQDVIWFWIRTRNTKYCQKVTIGFVGEFDLKLLTPTGGCSRVIAGFHCLA